MIQVLPQSPNVGANIGSALGQSITALADSHLGHIVKKQQRKEAQLGLEALGYSKEKAAKLSQFDPQILKEIVKGKVGKSQITQNFGGTPEEGSPLREAIQIATNRHPSQRNSQSSQLKSAQQETPFQPSGPLQNLQQLNQNIGVNNPNQFAQQDPKMAALNALKASPYAQLLGQWTGEKAPNVLEQLQQAPGKEFLQGLQQNVEQQEMSQQQAPQQMNQQPSPKKRTADDIRWEDLTPEQAKHVRD